MHGLVLPRACQGLLARIQAGRHEAGAPRRAAGHRHPAPASLSSSSTRARPPGRPLHVNAAAQQRHAQHAPGSRLACSDTHCGTIPYSITLTTLRAARATRQAAVALEVPSSAQALSASPNSLPACARRPPEPWCPRSIDRPIATHRNTKCKPCCFANAVSTATQCRLLMGSQRQPTSVHSLCTAHSLHHSLPQALRVPCPVLAAWHVRTLQQ